MDSNFGRLIPADAMTWRRSQDTSLFFAGRPADGGSLRSNTACQDRLNIGKHWLSLLTLA